MLVSDRGTTLQLVTQPDHAVLAEQLGAAWGDERFPVPARRDSLLTAARRHDDGWSALDGVPAVNAEAGRPAHFLEVQLADTIGPYGRGVDAIYADDPYAGLLASMHWAGLYSRRWGVQAGPAVDHPLARAVVGEQEDRWRTSAREQWGGEGLRSRFEADLWHGYEVLQALDLLSLAICLLDTSVPTDPRAEALPTPAVLRDVAPPPGGRIIPAIPTADGTHQDLTLRVAARGVVEVAPFPFAAPEVAVTFTARVMDADPGRDDAAVAEAYRAASAQEVPVTIVRSDA